MANKKYDFIDEYFRETGYIDRATQKRILNGDDSFVPSEAQKETYDLLKASRLTNEEKRARRVRENYSVRRAREVRNNEKSDMPEITAEEKEVFNKYGIEPESFSNEEFETWAENHNFEYRLTGGMTSEYKWLPKHANKWNPFKFLTTKEEESDKEVLERYLERKAVQTNAKNHPIFTSAVTVATAPYRGLAGAVATGKDVVLSAFDKEINTNDTAHNIVEDANFIRETVTDEHASKWFGGASGKLGNYGALAYNAAMSIGDTVMTSLTTRGLGSGFGLSGKALTKFTANTTSTLLGSNSAASTIMQKKKEGLSDGKAVAVGFTTGLAEFITEKYSLEAIFKAPTSTIKKGLISFVAEGSEEGVSDILSKTADYFIAGDDSTIRKNITQYMKNGMSRKDATIQATQDSLWETASSVLVGGLSGVAMSSAYHGFGVSEIKNTGKDMRGVATDVIQQGLESPENSISYKYAEKLQKKGIDKITDYELGMQHIYNIEQIEYEQKNEAKALKKAAKMGEITYPSAESVSDVSAYKNKAVQQTVDVQAPTWNVRNASADAVNTTISQDNDIVNNSIRRNAGYITQNDMRSESPLSRQSRDMADCQVKCNTF